MSSIDLIASYLFDDMIRNSESVFRRNNSTGYPVTDVYQSPETGDTVLEFALAGFNKEDIKIEVRPDKNLLTVSYDSKSDKTENPIRRIAKRSFVKSFSNYSNKLDLSKTTASFKDGLLTIVVPARASEKPQVISIE